MPLLSVRNLTKQYNGVPAVQALSFDLERGQCLGVAGESGGGKSTLARLLTLLERPDEGQIFLEDREITTWPPSQRRQLYRTVQLVFQNPQSTFDPRQTVGAALRETAVNFGAPRARAYGLACSMLRRVGLDEALLARYTHELSGGQCQRAAIARALLARPQLLICDELTSALDTVVGAQILSLLREIQVETGMALLVISHDLAMMCRLCSSVLVLDGGALAEQAPVHTVLFAPRSPAAKRLADAARSWTL